MGKQFRRALLLSGLLSIHPLLGDIRIVPKERTPEPNNVDLTLVYPHSQEVKSSSSVDFQFRLEGYPLGTDTEYQPRASELRYDPTGQSIRILVDNVLCAEMDEALIDALDNNADYFEQRITGRLKCELDEGEHILQAFPIRSYDESLKGRTTYVASIFYVKNKINNKNIDLSKPYITYNQPYGTYVYSATRPILLDFIVRNCQLSADGFKIRFSIDGKVERVLTAWIPYYIYGLPKGSHTIRLELLNAENKEVTGFFTDVTQTIIIE